MNSRPSILILLLFGIVAVCLAIYGGTQPFTPDSANYIEQSRSLLSGNGFSAYSFDLNESKIGGGPDRLFPPGYPILIAVSSLLSGTAVEVAAPWVNRVALLILPVTIFLSFRNIVGNIKATLLGTLSILSPGVILWGQFALTDVLSLTFVIAAFGCSLAAWNASDKPNAIYLPLVGGILSGCSYLIRNANLALLITIFSAMMICYLLPSNEKKNSHLKILLAWAVGVSVIVSPWMIRNIIVFGTAQPYEMPPSTISAWLNVRAFISAFISEITGSSPIGNVIAWSQIGLAALLALSGIVMVTGFNQLLLLNQSERNAVIFSFIYILIGSTLVIAARTKYQWGEVISNRHAIQYGIFFILIACIFSRISVFYRVLFSILVGVLAINFIVRVIGIISLPENQRDQENWMQTSERAANRIKGFKSHSAGPCVIERDGIIVSNYAFLYRSICSYASVHPANNDLEKIPKFIESVGGRVAIRPLMIALHPGRGAAQSFFPMDDRQLEEVASQGWEIVENSETMVFLRKR